MRSWRVHIGLLALLAAAMALCAPALAQNASLRTAVKAAYLYKFAPFVAWPESPEYASAPFDICVIGDDPFGSVLDKVVEGQTVGTRPILIHRFPDETNEAKVCEIMYIAGSKRRSVKDMLSSVKGLPILTVTDEERGRGPHGMIHFIEQGGAIRFEIDEAAAQESGIAISSKLLDLAIAVRRVGGAVVKPQ